MKLLMITALVLATVSVTASAQNKAELKTQIDSVSYSIGQDIAHRLKQQQLEVNPVALAQGLQDALGGQSALTPDQMQGVLMALQQKMMEKQQAAQAEQQKAMAASADKNQKEGAAYLAENKKKKGVTTLPSGLQYEVITAGKGKKPKATDQVTVHYRGTLIDGTEFDSSIGGQPATFPVNGVIQGWVEALQLMPEGSKWRLVLPSDLAYGAQGAGGKIGPNAVLVFEVELISVK